jgi:hypothetical protein
MANYQGKNNPKKNFKNKPDFSVQAHATLRIQNKRIEIGLRIPPEFEQRIYEFLSDKKNPRPKRVEAA